jgi:uncharacterized paraquat-inducible protein A
VSTDTANTVILLGSMVVPLAALAVVCWLFWSKRHND